MRKRLTYNAFKGKPFDRHLLKFIEKSLTHGPSLSSIKNWDRIRKIRIFLSLYFKLNINIINIIWY